MILAPTIELIPPPPSSDQLYRKGTWMIPCSEVGDRLWRFDWILFTSANAVRYSEEAWSCFGGLKRALELNPPQENTHRVRKTNIACVGTSTQRALKRLGVELDLLPKEFHAEGLLEALKHENFEGKRVLIPRALEARELLPLALRSRGAEVWISPMYQTVQASLSSEVKLQMLSQREASCRARAIIFTSDSTVSRLLEQLDDREQRLLKQHCDAWVIGPVVKKAAEREGFRVRGMASPHTIEALIDHLVRDLGES